MSGTGYASLGHLFELLDDQAEEDQLKNLRRIVGRFYEDADDHRMLHANGLNMFDKFFGEVKISVDSSQAFLSGILKAHGVDELWFQLRVEKTVWHVLRFCPDFYNICNI